MNANELQRLRSKMEATLCTLEAAAITAKLKLKESSEVNPNVFRDELDFAKAEVELKTLLGIHNRNVSRQHLLRHALARMEVGTFGMCLSCGDEIGSQRLESLPEAVHCIDCKSFEELESGQECASPLFGSVPPMAEHDYCQERGVA